MKKIEITTEKERFKEHLNIENNNNIIFSGIFGIGKTYFLKEYFDNQTEFTPIYITPVHYSISSNNDIINYIKYDLIFELLKTKGLEYEYDKIPLKFTSQDYITKNIGSILSKVLKHSGKIGKLASEIIEDILHFRKEIIKHQEKFTIDDKADLLDFLEDSRLEKGSIYEEDNISIVISSLIGQLKNPVLIIDDLDRLDPEHIFRILNIFACHMDINSELNNKFNFSKTILVCDINNIKSIFKSKYGLDTDFNGYIDKFYSQQIFHFDNKTEIINNLTHIFIETRKATDSKLFQTDKRTNEILRFLLTELIKNDYINLRVLLKSTEYRQVNQDRFIIITEKHKHDAYINNFDLVLIFNFLSELLGNKLNLEEVIRNYAKTVNDKILHINEYTEEVLAPYIFLIDYLNHQQKSGSFTYKNENLNLLINYEITNHGRYYYINNIVIKDNNKNIKKYFPYSKILLEVYKVYSQMQFYRD